MRIRLPSDHQAPGEARAFVRAHLAGTILPGHLPVDDVALIASELVTNAVHAGALEIDLVLDVTDHDLRLSVEDDAAGWPRVMAVDEHATNGRGLHMVQQLADVLSVTPRARGKRVTASWSGSSAPSAP